MNPILKNILAVVAGIVIGAAVNMLIISISGSLVPLPEGVDPNDMESIKANMHRYETMHFIMPFLAHALGTLVGAFVAAKIAANRKRIFALLIGGVFLIGGIMMVVELPSPAWFNALDLVVAYFPMGWLGFLLAKK
ncbi:MAG: hypothetical protein NXI09_15165 [Bacteroidetes bacterium]|nr:hypothetical protein [Bacteroidota bacterium]